MDLSRRLGIFAKTFSRTSLEETLGAIASNGIQAVQFNLSCVGLPTLPDAISQPECERIRSAFDEAGLEMVAISGTFNPLTNDPARREDDLRRLDILASACPRFSTNLITLCSGTLDQQDMWRHHPGNTSREAWSNMVAMMRRIAKIAEARDVVMAFEPETGNVVDSAQKARQLLDEIGSPRLRVVLDPANLFSPENVARRDEVVLEAFALLAPDISLLHGKDILPDGSGTTVPGLGILDYQTIFELIHRYGIDVPFILHGMREDQVMQSIAYIKQQHSSTRFMDK
jgi:sugar phosphate isomerase/epimerase